MKGRVPVPDIAHHVKQHYLEKPGMEEKWRNDAALHNSTIWNPEEIVPVPGDAIKPQPQKLAQPMPSYNPAIVQEKENVQPENAAIPFEHNIDEHPNNAGAVEVATPENQFTLIQNDSQVVNNQLCQAPMLFPGATFHNGTINLNVPQ